MTRKLTQDPRYAVPALMLAAAVADQEAQDVIDEAAWDAADEDSAYLPTEGTRHE